MDVSVSLKMDDTAQSNIKEATTNNTMSMDSINKLLTVGSSTESHLLHRFDLDRRNLSEGGLVIVVCIV